MRQLANALVPRDPYKTGIERERAAYHQARLLAGLIRRWRYEPMKFRLADGRWYTPDFLILENDWSQTVEEAKGWSKNLRDGITRFKAIADLNPEYRWVFVTKEKKAWKLETY